MFIFICKTNIGNWTIIEHNSPNSQYFFMKISWIVPWISRIDWCEGLWCGSTYMVVRLSDISSKAAYIKHKKCIFCLFLSLCRTASWPYKLSHTNALLNNQFYKLKSPIHEIFMKKYWEMAELENEVFLRRPFWIF